MIRKAMALGAAVIAFSAPAQGDPLEPARRAYEAGRYVEAQSRLLPAAYTGNPEAQELLGLMYAFGPQLFPGVPRDLNAASGWLDRAARNGSSAARYLHCAFSHRLALQAPRFCFDRIGRTGEPPAHDAAGAGPGH